MYMCYSKQSMKQFRNTYGVMVTYIIVQASPTVKVHHICFKPMLILHNEYYIVFRHGG